MMKPYLLIFLAIITISCSTTRKTDTSLKETPIKDTILDDNNHLIVKSNNTTHNSSSNDKIVFEGKNNLIEVNYDSSSYNSQNSNNVIIVKGNQNNVIINQKGVIDSSVNSKDTLIIQGTETKNSLTGSGTGNLKNSSNKNLISSTSEIIKLDLDSQTFQNSILSDDIIIPDTTPVFVNKANTIMTIHEAFMYYTTEAKKGDIDAYFQLGYFYLTGMGTTIQAKKAEEYFEYAARKGNTEAQSVLGSIYEKGLYEYGVLVVPQDRSKAIYYYSLAAEQGNNFAKDKLIELKE